MSKKEKSLKSLLIALAPSLVGMGINTALNGDLLHGGLLIGVGLATAVLYEVLQERQIKVSVPNGITDDLLEKIIADTTERTSREIRDRWAVENAGDGADMPSNSAGGGGGDPGDYEQ